MSKLIYHKLSSRFQSQTILILALLLSGLSVQPVISASAPPGVIKNQATGSFVDDIDTTNTMVTIESNTVQVTVAEVAGIAISDPTISEPTATTIGATAAPFQGITGVNQDDVIYFDFVITNAGNDPTQFFIPGNPFQVIGGTFDRTLYGAVQIVQITNATGAIVPLIGNVAKIDIPAAGANTGDLTVLGIPAGSIPAGGSVTVRIPVKVTGGSGTSVRVALGDTGANDNGVGTVNQTYTASTTTGADVHTHDNPNNLTLDSPVAGEADGVLATSAEKEASRFGLAPIVVTPQVVGFKSAKLTDSNNDTKINPGETVTWTIDYVNTGSVDVTNFQITDILPMGVTKSGAVTLSVSGTGQAAPIVNTGYTGTTTTLGITDTLFTTPITLKVGGAIKVTIPVTINSGITGILSNQSSGTATNLPTVGIKTDNAGANTDLPTNIQNSPYSVTVPTGSISQTTTTAIDPTTITVVAAQLSVPSICSAAGGTLGTNLFSNGSFGTGSSTPGTTGSALPAGRTTYTPVTYGSGAPNDGQYSIVNQLNQTTFDYWFNPVSGHTTGAVNDQMMVVNADYQPGTFYAETVTVPANQTMNFGFWILNLPSSNSYGWTQYGGGTAGDPNASGSNKKPDISLAVNRIGVDDNNDGVIDELGEAQVIDITGAVPFTSSPTWIQYGTLFNSGSATQIEFRLINNAPGGNGNDLALDDLTVAPCSLPSGNITGTLYRDRNTNNAYNSGTDPTMPANIAVNLKNSSDAIVATAYTDASGGYSFTNVPVGSSYTIAVILTDPDIPSGATATANPSGANTTGIQTGVTVTAGATLADRNFGFSAPAIASNPNLLLVKRITAINGNTTNGNIFLNTYDPETDITNSSYPYDKNVIQSGITPPSSDKWPNTSGISPISSSFLVGARNGGTTKPNDSIEYTIYFLSAGDSAAKNVLFCDRVPDNVTFIPNTFTNTIANPSGAARGIAVQLGNTPNYYTNSGDTDPGRYFPPGIEPSTVYGNKINCGGANNNGAVVVNLGDLTNAIGVGTPLDSHGFVRFRGLVK